MPNDNPNHTPAKLAVNGSGAMGYYLIAIVLLVLDQITKFYFENTLEFGQSIEVIPPVFSWTLAYNYGAAFSFLAEQSGWQKWFFSVLGIVVAGFIISYLRKVPKAAPLLSFGLALVLGGAIGNVIDRIIHGHVIDFIHVHYADVWHYPIFNIADIGICVGMALVVIDMLFLEKKRQPKAH